MGGQLFIFLQSGECFFVEQGYDVEFIDLPGNEAGVECRGIQGDSYPHHYQANKE